jgi:hypothetical protein
VAKLPDSTRGAIVAELVNGALPGMTVEVREDFASSRILVTTCYRAYAVTSVDIGMLLNDEAKVIDALARAAEESAKTLRAHIEKDLGKTR